MEIVCVGRDIIVEIARSVVFEDTHIGDRKRRGEFNSLFTDGLVIVVLTGFRRNKPIVACWEWFVDTVYVAVFDEQWHRDLLFPTDLRCLEEFAVRTAEFDCIGISVGVEIDNQFSFVKRDCVDSLLVCI
ncbi:hypothetical protein C451_05333 [Halococcus thailandensis JCM 13552]|uniref:Uncharacterized protein n=1 Tax=Halococcus thailandensis JCM 13552 TaxID=1227457 RepID=M0NE43_9EURY|nr:hypothetical protein C451_05333 [Halococcus thailandensis JCM 13552]